MSILLGACASHSVFNPYPNQAVVFQNSIAPAEGEESRLIDQTLSDLANERDNADAMLYLMERGRIAQLDSRFAESKSDFENVIARFEQQDLAATVQVSELVSQSSSLLSNDNAIPYKGAGYERIFTHLHQAFNYLGEQDREGASVEFRKAALEQRVLLEKYEDEIADTYREAEENNIGIDLLAHEYSGLDRIAGQVKSSFQNAYTFYVSAAFWESIGEYNSALVDYKKAFEINPDNHFIKQDIERLTQSNLIDRKDSEGTLVVFFEEGFVPAKSEIRIPIPMFDGGFISLAFPYYDTNLWAISPSLKAVDEQFIELGMSEVVVDVSALAVKDLKENLPQLFVRQTLRAIAKHQFENNATKQGGALGQFVANIYNVVSESADRRSWLTLPATAQIMRFNLAQGVRVIDFSTPEAQISLSLNIKPGRTTFVRIVQANNRLVSQVYSI